MTGTSKISESTKNKSPMRRAVMLLPKAIRARGQILKHRVDGMATVEYVLVTLAAAALAAVLIAVVKSDWVQEAIAKIVSGALSGG